MMLKHKTSVIVTFFLLILIFSIKAFPIPSQQQSKDSLAAARMNRAANQVLAPVYPYLARYIADTFDLQGANGIGIDVGGGPGNLVTELCKYTQNFYWINADINPWYFPYVYRKAKKHHCQGQIGSIRADAMNLPFRDDFADVIVSRASFHFWEDMWKGFLEIKRVLKPGGKAIVGRGLPPNMPLETARKIRKKQSSHVTGYNPNDFAEDFQLIMEKLKITDFTVIIPKPTSEVKYGIWIVFTK